MRSFLSGADRRLQTTTTSSVDPGGVLAQPSNIGGYGQTHLATVGELGIRVEYALTQQLYASCGYTLIYWSSVARVAEGIDRVVRGRLDRYHDHHDDLPRRFADNDDFER